MISFVLLLSLHFIARHCNSQEVIKVPVGVLFWREFTPQSFNFTEATGKCPAHNIYCYIYFSIDERPSIHYSVSSQPFAGLPAWLSFYQRNSLSSGILYGTPTFTDVGRFDVQVIALNRKRFDSVKLTIPLNVTEHTMGTGGFLPSVNKGLYTWTT